MTCRRVNEWATAAGFLTAPATAGLRRALYQRPMHNNTTMPRIAASENQPRLDCPRGRMMRAARSGPTAVPKLPPTWNRDWASPNWPPEAMRATRDDSGWNTDEPTPVRAAATRITAKLSATAIRAMPARVQAMPKVNE